MTTSQRWTMLATILGTSMVFLDGTIVNLALPHIGRELPASLVSTLEGQTYVVTFSFSPTVDDDQREAVAESVLASWAWA